MGLFFDKPEEPGRTQRLDALEARVQQLEAMVALMTQEHGSPAPAGTTIAGLSTDVLARVQRLKRDGKVIHAVKGLPRGHRRRPQGGQERRRRAVSRLVGRAD